MHYLKLQFSPLVDSPRNGSPIRNMSPRHTKSDSKLPVSDSSSQASLKDEYTTPPDSPVPRRAQLKKEPEFDRASQSPPGSPAVRPKSDPVPTANGVGSHGPGHRKSSLGSPHTSPARGARLVTLTLSSL